MRCGANASVSVLPFRFDFDTIPHGQTTFGFVIQPSLLWEIFGRTYGPIPPLFLAGRTKPFLKEQRRLEVFSCPEVLSDLSQTALYIISDFSQNTMKFTAKEKTQMKNYANADKPQNPPEDFPQIALGDDERRSDLARRLLWQHTISHGPDWKSWLYDEDKFPKYPELPAGPKATLWDGWMCTPELWPAVHTDTTVERMRSLWKETLLARHIDGEGYVETDQGVFYAHTRGWPFPLWESGDATIGWHFTFHGQQGELGTPSGMTFRIKNTCTTEGFTVEGLRDDGLDDGWQLGITAPDASVETPAIAMEAHQAPYMQVRWHGENIGHNEPYLEWQREEDTDYSPSRRMYFTPCPNCETLHNEEDILDHSYIMVPLYKHREWSGYIKRLRVQLGNTAPGGNLTLLALFPNYDTRINVNNPQYVRGCIDFFDNTRDLDFLRRNIFRMRMSLRAYMHDHHTLSEHVVKTTWVGHEGKDSLRMENGELVRECGRSVQNNWLDILPFGYYDCFATVYYYDAVRRFSKLEQQICGHPEWNIAYSYDAFDPSTLSRHAAEVKERGNELFWNRETGRFAAGVDIDGIMHDVGITMHNLEAVCAGFATNEHAKSIMDWISGIRTVEGDASQGADIYCFDFAPRITTKLNEFYWFWGWDPKWASFSNQIQDGGAALAFSYFDIMSRLAVYGADNAWERLSAILDWYGDVCEAGGYKAYYDNRNMSLQGGNSAGALGITSEFFESLLPVQSVLHGFLGYRAAGDHIVVNPSLPSHMEELRITNIAYDRIEMDITVSRNEKTVSIVCRGQNDASAQDIDRELTVVTQTDFRIVIREQPKK